MTAGRLGKRSVEDVEHDTEEGRPFEAADCIEEAAEDLGTGDEGKMMEGAVPVTRDL